MGPGSAKAASRVSMHHEVEVLSVRICISISFKAEVDLLKMPKPASNRYGFTVRIASAFSVCMVH